MDFACGLCLVSYCLLVAVLDSGGHRGLLVIWGQVRCVITSHRWERGKELGWGVREGREQWGLLRSGIIWFFHGRETLLASIPQKSWITQRGERWGEQATPFPGSHGQLRPNAYCSCKERELSPPWWCSTLLHLVEMRSPGGFGGTWGTWWIQV